VESGTSNGSEIVEENATSNESDGGEEGANESDGGGGPESGAHERRAAESANEGDDEAESARRIRESHLVRRAANVNDGGRAGRMRPAESANESVSANESGNFCGTSPVSDDE